MPKPWKLNGAMGMNEPGAPEGSEWVWDLEDAYRALSRVTEVMVYEAADGEQGALMDAGRWARC